MTVLFLSWRYEFGVLASHRFADAAVAFSLLPFGQPSDRQAVVVSADRRVVVSDAEGDIARLARREQLI